MKINNLKQLYSFLYPHWEARTKDNRVVFIGYTKGHLEVCVGHKNESSHDTILRSMSSYRKRIYGKKISNNSGISEEKLLKIIEGIRYS